MANLSSTHAFSRMTRKWTVFELSKYRGSTHGTNEYPFLIDDKGISVLPVATLDLTHDAAEFRIRVCNAANVSHNTWMWT
jgi:hypothetical protein